jgi:prepilin-type N-terminal cleavage/methylation domain-containing protein
MKRHSRGFNLLEIMVAVTLLGPRVPARAPGNP